jgi:hypothetical protein
VADSEDVGTTVVFQPRRLRVVCSICAVAVIAVCTAVSFGLHGATGDGPGVFQRGDQLAMIGLGVLFAAGIMMFTRPRITADDTGVKIRNVVGGYELPWAVIRAVRFDRGASWASLDLADDEVVSVMAIQAHDKEYAVEAVRTLRAMLAAHAQAPA